MSVLMGVLEFAVVVSLVLPGVFSNLKPIDDGSSPNELDKPNCFYNSKNITSFSGSIHFVTEMLEPARDWSALHLAIFHYNLPEIDKQIENGADIDALTGDGETALHISMMRNSDYIKAVLKHKPSMNVADKNELLTPLLMFVSFCSHRTSTLKLMLEMGADPNLSNIDGNAPLHLIADAFKSEWTKALKYAEKLIKFGANVNAQNNCGDTPLHVAIKSGFTRLIRILLRKGANIKIRNFALKSPLHFVLRFKIKSSDVFIEFGKYIVKQTKIKKLFLNQNILNEFYESTILKMFKDRCDQELSQLKISVTDEISVTYYDLLVSPPDVVTKYLRNETLKSVLTSDKKKYIYGYELSKIIRDSILRNKAIYIGYQFFEEFSPVILPDLCLDAICSHLTNEDLLKLKNFTC